MSYADLASTLASIQSAAGGTREQRLASAHLLIARCHMQFVELARDLLRVDIRSDVFEDASYVSLRVDSVTVVVRRFSGDSKVTFEFLGFDARVVPLEHTRQDVDVPATSVEGIESMVKKAIDGIGTILKSDRVLKQR